MIRIAALLGLALVVTVKAEAPLSSPHMEGTELLRAVSLDLRGVVPTLEEYRSIQSGTPVSDFVDQWMEEPGFADRVARHHRSLLWNSLDGVRLTNNRSRIVLRSGLWFRSSFSVVLRGQSGLGCTDRDATFDDDGRPILEEVSPGIYDDGAVWIDPYWDPGNPVRVCALDAMAERYSPSGVDCASSSGASNAECGCGPNLQWCITPAAEAQILTAMGDDIDRRVETMVLEDQSYLDLLTDHTGYVNGPLVHFLTHLTRRGGGVRFEPEAIESHRLPELPYTDEGLVKASFGDHHSGVLTSPAWLLRFQTQRARANQFYNSFLCQPFVPPSTGLPEVTEEAQTLDLTARQGCQYCHALLEPAAAHWGRWLEARSAYLPPHEYPAYSEDCETCSTEGGCSDVCDDYYVVDQIAPELAPFMGRLSAFQFLEDRHMSNVDEGPSLLVHRTATDGRLPECVAEKAVTWLVGREPAPEEEAWVKSLATEFATSGFDYKTLVRSVVTSDNYRRLP